MNPIVEEVQSTYKVTREKVNYSIIDIEYMLKELADTGTIWMIQGMKDLAESESILINHYLNEKRELQIYDFVQSSVIPQNKTLSKPFQ